MTSILVGLMVLCFVWLGICWLARCDEKPETPEEREQRIHEMLSDGDIR